MIEEEFIARNFAISEETVIGKYKFVIYDISDWPKGAKMYNYCPGNMDVYYENEFLFNSNTLIKMFLNQKNPKWKSDYFYDISYFEDSIVKFNGNLFTWDFDMQTKRIVSRTINK
ncbi:hypothetical protein CI105_06250 [Candidatus Izimaplasma bacterium ZiA1]|uniref:hypothetical protein n=1 Tax=Candidatus Izimoplasma sp. ZiA1 TaxID=2024899 RepID=UPI000BAA749D|nr:hypothetical protein CI105_06250 [Candidatus Izimaplasma bacterium ZiA1]